MRITILAFGSRGDVQPMVALGAGLLGAGFSVRIATDRAFEPLACTHGLEFAPVAGDIQASLNTEDGQRALESGANPILMGRLIRRNLEPVLRQVIHDTQAATEETDALLLGGIGYYPGTILSEARGLPFAQAYLQPMLSTAAYPSPMLPLPRNPERSLRNRLGYIASGQVFWQTLRPVVNRVRREEFGLRPWPLWGNFGALQRERVLQVHGFSRHVLPAPSDWPEFAIVTGYWFLPPAPYTPPRELAAFLESGALPVCIGFGSMGHRDPAALTRTVIEAVQQSGQRAILLAGWGALASDAARESLEANRQLLVMEEAPHDWLFSRCAAVVHHGGAGTTAAGLRAGKPSILCPFFGDQPFWAWRVQTLGVGPAPIPQAELTAERLALAICQAVSDAAMQARAEAIGAAIRAEDGVTEAVSHLAPYFRSRRMAGTLNE